MKPVPDFPKKRPLALEDKTLFDGLFKKYPPVISEFTFTNLFAWRHAYQFSVAAFNGYLLVISSKENILSVLDPIGDIWKKKEAIENIFSLGEGEVRFIRLPGPTAALFEKENCFRLQEDRDNFDYLYRTADLAGLKGRDFDAKRNFIKRFKASHAFVYKKLTSENVEACFSFQEEWCLAKDCLHTEGLAAEREAMRQILKNFQALGIAGAMIEIKGKVEAVTLGERLNPETFVIHIEKANGNFIGIYQAINQFFCVSEAQEFAYVNREQDLGVPGLRQAKESYHPCRMVKKYTLVQK